MLHNGIRSLEYIPSILNYNVKGQSLEKFYDSEEEENFGKFFYVKLFFYSTDFCNKFLQK